MRGRVQALCEMRCVFLFAQGLPPRDKSQKDRAAQRQMAESVSRTSAPPRPAELLDARHDDPDPSGPLVEFEPDGER